MTTRRLASVLAVVLTIAIVTPTTFLINPPRVNAQYAVHIVGDSSPTSLTTAAKTTITAIQATLTQVSAHTSAWAANADWVYKYVLQPLAFIMSGKLIKMMTAGIINYVIGKANGTGIPQFVVDVQKSIRGVADGAALAYLKQIGNTNSPFAGSIASALNTEYLSKSSLEGFWAVNMCTLNATSIPTYTPAYITGRWSDGGIAAWFALTTLPQNNPYTMYQITRSRMATVIGPGVGGVTGSRMAQLDWGQGFLSWCGATDVNAVPSATGISPGDPCMKDDGTAGSIQTPGSVIKATLDKVLGAQQDQIVRMGDVSGQVNGILGNIATIFNTVNFATQLLGGGSSGGLLTAGESSPAEASVALSSYQNSSAMGLTETGVVQAATSVNPDVSVTGANVADRVSKYKSAWNSIGSAVNGASASLSSLATTCTSEANKAALELWNASNQEVMTPPTQAQLDSMHSPFIDAARAQAAAVPDVYALKIAPVLVQVSSNTSPTAFADTIAMAQLVQDDLSSGSSAYISDLQALQLMPPSQADLASAQFNATALQVASASPQGSLNVGSSSDVPIVDQMNLISANAQALKNSVCTNNFGFMNL